MKKEVSQLMFKKYVEHRCDLPEYNPNATFNWIQHHSGLPWLRLGIPIPFKTILQEIKNIESLLSTHRDDYSEHSGWKSFCIHGKSYNSTREDEYYADTKPYIWTPESEKLMPETVKYFKNDWPATKYARIRVMLLEPGGYVSIHRDHDDSRLSAINIAITQPKGCNFVMEKFGSVPFVEGAAYWLDISNNHTVFNHSDQPRWHLIVHQLDNSQNFQNEVVKSYNIMYNMCNENGYNNNQRRS
jgi:hypothetical protein